MAALVVSVLDQAKKKNVLGLTSARLLADGDTVCLMAVVGWIEASANTKSLFAFLQVHATRATSRVTSFSRVLSLAGMLNSGLTLLLIA